MISDRPVPLIADKNLKLRKRWNNEWKGENFLFSVSNTEVLYRCQWEAISKEAFLIIKAIQVFTLLSFSFLSVLNHGSDFLFQFSKVIFLLQTYCGLSSITMNIVQELRLSKLRMLQTQRQQQQLEILRAKLQAILGGASTSRTSKMGPLNRPLKEEDEIELPLEDDSAPLSFWEMILLKLEWFFRNIYYDYAFTITIMHLIKLQKLGIDLTFVDDLTDIGNSFELLIDLLICAFPVRVYHVIYSYIFGGMFLLFTYVFHMYEIGPETPPPETNWNDPDVVLISCYVLVGVTLCHIFTFSIYQLRVVMYSSVYRHKYFSKVSGYREESITNIVHGTVVAAAFPLKLNK